MKIGRWSFLVTAVVVVLLPPGAHAGDADPQYGDSEVFATVPPQTHPEGIVAHGPTVFVSTTVGVDGPVVGNGRPSRIFMFDRRTGGLRGEIVVEGEDTMAFHGIGGLVTDGLGRLYAVDAQGRILRFHLDGPSPVQETYATIPDLEPCLGAVSTEPCSPTPDDRPPLPNDLVFDADGNLYVTDSFQATIYRIRPGPGPTEIWFQDPALDGNAIGVNGIEVSPDATRMYFAVTGDRLDRAVVYTLPLVEHPSANELRLVASWQSGGADGLHFGARGQLYVTLFAFNQVAVLNPDGTEFARIESELFDEPATIAFDRPNASLLIPNHAFLNPQPEPRRIVNVYVADRGAPLFRPLVP